MWNGAIAVPRDGVMSWVRRAKPVDRKADDLAETSRLFAVIRSEKGFQGWSRYSSVRFFRYQFKGV